MTAPYAPPPGRRRLAVLGVALTTLITSGLPLGPASAQSTSSGSLRGVVLGGGTGVPQVAVSLELVDGSCGTPCASRPTDDAGSYLFTGLPAGTYRLRMEPPRHPSGTPYPGPQYSGRTYSPSTAETFTVGDGELAREDTLLNGGSIRGVVTDPSGTPLRDIAVTSVDVSPNVFDPPGRTVVTDAAGAFSLRGLRPGEHSLYLREAKQDGRTWASEYYSAAGGTDSLGSADKLVVAEDGAVDVSAALAVGGSISGTLTTRDAQGALVPVPGIGVHVVASGAGGRLAFLDSGATDDTGRYTVTGLSSGSKIVTFIDRRGTYARQNYRSQYLHGTPVEVTAPDPITGSDDVLSLGAAISGVVTGADGTPAGGVFVHALGSTGASSGAVSAPDGSYSLESLPPGDYQLRFSQGSIGIFYKDAPRPCDAQLVTLTPPADVTSIDQQLPAAAPTVEPCPATSESPSPEPSPSASATPPATESPSPSPTDTPPTATPSPSEADPTESTAPSPSASDAPPASASASPTSAASPTASPTVETPAGSPSASPSASAAAPEPVVAPAQPPSPTAEPATAAPSASPTTSSSPAPVVEEAVQEGLKALPTDATPELRQAVTTAMTSAVSVVSSTSGATAEQQAAAIGAVAAVVAQVAANPALDDAQRVAAIEVAAAVAGALATLPSTTTATLQDGLASGLDALSATSLTLPAVQAALIQSVAQTVAVLTGASRTEALTSAFVQGLLTATGGALATGDPAGSTSGVTTSTSVLEDGRLEIVLGSLEPGTSVVVVLNLTEQVAPALVGALRNGTAIYASGTGTARAVAVAGTVGPDGSVRLVSPTGTDLTGALRSAVLTVVGSARGGQQTAFANAATAFSLPEVPTLNLQPTAASRGQAVAASGTGTPGAVVRLFARPFGGGYTQVRQAVIPANGQWSFLLRPDRNTRILVRSTRTDGATAVDGPSAVAVVNAAVQQGARRVAPATYVFSGKVAPAGAGTLVTVTGRTADGAPVVVGSTRTTADGSWRLTRRFLSTVAIETVARTRGDGRSGAGSSSPLRFTIR